MAALGWLLNLGFAGSGIAVTGQRSVAATLATVVSDADSISTTVTSSPGLRTEVSDSDTLTEGSL